jgi:23S rRNA pseudouridine2605 synthase
MEHGERIPLKSDIVINGRKLYRPSKVYFMLNKPKDYISTVSDEFGRKNVLSLIKTKERIFPIGRLDKDTHGLLLLTNDGELTNLLIHPRYHILKIYQLTIKGAPSEQQLDRFKNGVELDDGKTLPANIQISYKETGKTVLKVGLFEGRKRQIRRMCETLGMQLLDLQRIEFGPLELGNLKLGEHRTLTSKEVQLLKDSSLKNIQKHK